MRRRAFLTGATGFVGRHLVESLAADGWEIRALARATSNTDQLEKIGAEIVVGDLNDPLSFISGLDGVDVAYHLAAVTAARNELEYQAANAEGTRALLDGIRRVKDPPGKLVYLSSYAVMGPMVGETPPGPDDTPAPLTAYGRSKLGGEQLVQEAADDNLEVTVVRAPAVYGPGDRALLPYFQLIRRRLAPVPGGEDRRLHLIFAPDLALALRRAADGDGGTFAVADPTIYRWSEVVGTIARVLDKRPITLSLPPALVRLAAMATEGLGRIAGRAVPFNREKAEEMLAPAWVCNLNGSELLLPPDVVTPLHSGIEQTVRWYIRQGWL